MFRFLICLSFVLGLMGCATDNSQWTRLERGKVVVLKELVRFPVLSSGTPGPGEAQHYHGLLPGEYETEAKDKHGTFYRAKGRLVLFDAEGESMQPLVEGGFWIADNLKHEPLVRLYRTKGSSMGNDGRDTQVVVQTVLGMPTLAPAQAGIGGAIGLAIVDAIESSGFRGWLFIPIKIDPTEEAKLLRAVY